MKLSRDFLEKMHRSLLDGYCFQMSFKKAEKKSIEDIEIAEVVWMRDKEKNKPMTQFYEIATNSDINKGITIVITIVIILLMLYNITK